MGKKKSNYMPEFHLFSDVIRHMVDESGVPMKAIAASAGKTYKTLLRELDNDDDMAKLGVDTLPLVMESCRNGSTEPPIALVWLAEAFGFHLVPTDASPDKNTLQDEMLDDYKCVVDLHNAMKRWDHPTIIDALATAAHADINQSVAFYKLEQSKRED